jgi:DNA polymerase-3 subunit beta
VFMSTQDVDFSTSAEEKTQCEYDGEAMVIGFNDENIIEVLSNINSDEIKVMLLDPSRAGIFLPVEQKDDEDLLILLMPMMI